MYSLSPNILGSGRKLEAGGVGVIPIVGVREVLVHYLRTMSSISWMVWLGYESSKAHVLEVWSLAWDNIWEVEGPLGGGV